MKQEEPRRKGLLRKIAAARSQPQPLPKEAVEPLLHPFDDVRRALVERRFTAPEVVESLAALGLADHWEDVYDISYAMGLEISLLFDAENSVWVDIGRPGMVRLSPPSGALLPFRLWVHTHPLTAYWSATDTHTLATVTPMLECAYVLGLDHYMQAVNRGDTPPEEGEVRLAVEGPLSRWTNEAIREYELFDNPWLEDA